MNINYLSIKGSSEWNEDALIMNEDLRIYGVLDGATSMVPYRSAKGETGGVLASQTVKHFFEELRQADGQSLEELLVKANAKLGEEMRNKNIDVTLKEHRWVTAAAVLKIEENHVEYVQVGDCMIVALYKDGGYRLLTRDHVAYIERQSRKQWEGLVDKKFETRDEYRRTVEPFIKKNKEKMNTLEGYSVLDGSEEAALFIESGKINRINLTELIIFSDGLFMHEEEGEAEPQDPIATFVRETAVLGIEGFAKYLVDLEEQDSDCIRFPRYKVSDDKSAIHITF